MLNYKKTDIGKNTFQYDVVIEKVRIQKAYDKAFDELAAQLEVAGFRKGKAPKDIAQKEIKKEAVYEKALNIILPDIYQELLQETKIKPMVNPKIDLLKAKDGEDWEIRITIAQKPTVDLSKYKEAVKLEEKKKDIWVPGKDEKKPDEKSKEENQRELLNKIFAVLLKNVKIEISDLIIQTELEKRLSQLVDDVRKIGLSIETYLKSKNETLESIRAKYTQEIEEMYKIEFILEEIAESEKITVEKADLEKLFTEVKDEKARADAQQNAYFYASLLRRQKTLDFLLSL